MNKYAFILAGLSMIGAGLAMWEEVRHGARHRRFGAITQLGMGVTFIGYGFFFERFPEALRFAWVVAAFVLAVAAWQVVTTVRSSRARRGTEAQRLRDATATGVPGGEETTAGTSHGKSNADRQ